MLTIKDSGRYANYLTGLINNIQNLMYSTANYTKTIETHFKSKGNPEAPDEIINSDVDRLFEGQIQDIIYLLQELIDEKLRLAVAIETAKKKLDFGWKEFGVEITLDTAYEYNKNIRTLMGDCFVGRIKDFKSSVKKSTGKAYKINVEGNQATYLYDIETKVELDYNKDIIKSFSKRALDKADTISTLIDQAELKEIVDFTPTYNVRDSFEDVIATYEAKISRK